MAKLKNALHEIFNYRGVLTALPIIFAASCFYYETEKELFLWSVGVMLVLLGVALRIWAEQHIHRRIRKSRQLTNTGPYAFVRNPLYLGNILICLGGVVTSELVWFVPLALGWFVLVYSLAIRDEEKRLLKQYGEEYRRYLRDVPCWLPRILPLKNPLFITDHWRMSVKAEVHSFLVLLPFIIKEIVSHRVEL